jgi:hypothetical protein
LTETHLCHACSCHEIRHRAWQSSLDASRDVCLDAVLSLAAVRGCRVCLAPRSSADIVATELSLGSIEAPCSPSASGCRWC